MNSYSAYIALKRFYCTIAPIWRQVGDELVQLLLNPREVLWYSCPCREAGLLTLMRFYCTVTPVRRQVCDELVLGEGVGETVQPPLRPQSVHPPTDQPSRPERQTHRVHP